MSQSATLYRISPNEFQRLEDAPGVEEFETSHAKDSCTFENTFLGLEFVLAKSLDDDDGQLVSEIFKPAQMTGADHFDNASEFEQFDLLESGSAIPYLDPETISSLVSLLQNSTGQDIDDAYDADELNDNGIYPGIWGDDEDEDSEETVFGKQQLIEDFTRLKKFLNDAKRGGDYILVSVG